MWWRNLGKHGEIDFAHVAARQIAWQTERISHVCKASQHGRFGMPIQDRWQGLGVWASYEVPGVLWAQSSTGTSTISRRR